MIEKNGLVELASHKNKFFTEEESQEAKFREKLERDNILQVSDNYYDNLTEDQRQEIRGKTEYIVTHNENPEIVSLEGHQKEKRISSVREAVTQNLNRDVYSNYDNIVKNKEKESRILKFHHARGTRINGEGGDSLSIDVAGSSFETRRREQSGFKGTDVKLNTPGKINRFFKVFGTKVKGIVGSISGLFSGSKKGIFKKERTNKNDTKNIRYTISGPPFVNIGAFKMQNVKSYIKTIGTGYIEPIFRNWLKDENMPKRDIEVNLQGHSRGAVATAVASKAIMEWANEKYPDFAKYIKLNFIQRDPVPGLGSRDGEYNSIDLREYKDTINATTMYSMHADKGDAFTPQEVRGQKRIILTTEKHSMGQSVVDKSQLQQAGETENEKYHQQTYVDSGNMQAYRGSGMSDMNDGVYMRDENNVLVRMRSYGEAKKVMDRVLKDTKGQKKRAQIIDKTIKNWFIDNEYVDDSMTDAERQRDHAVFMTNSTFLREIHSKEPDIPDKDDYNAVLKQVANIAEMLKRYKVGEGNDLIDRGFDKTIVSIKEYMGKEYKCNKESDSEYIQAHMEDISVILSTLRSEKKYINDLSEEKKQEFSSKTFDQLFGGSN